ncbi:MAG: FHA domain-containing protein [Gemmataceae bacterium]
MTARIQIVVGPDRGRTFVLTPAAPLEVGRSLATATQLTDAAVSRVHCQILYDGTQAILVNVSSRGTLVNGVPAAQQELHHGDIIRIGHTEFRFALDAMNEAETLYQPGDSGVPTRNDCDPPPGPGSA